MWWFPLALAQEEVCEPTPTTAVEATLTTAEAQLVAHEFVSAFSTLEHAERQLVCLDVVVDAPTLGRLAWLRAESYFFDQDEDGLWRWLRLAHDLGVDAPAHIDFEHPMTRFSNREPTPPGLTGPNRIVDPPRRGGLYLDGTLLQAPRARAETPHLVQVFVGKERQAAWWQAGAQFRPDHLAIAPPEPPPQIGPKKWKPEKKNTVEAWEAWIVDNPDSEWVTEAVDRLDRLRFAQAEAGGKAGLRAYLDDPGKRARRAEAALEKLDFDATKAENSRPAWQAYLARNPKGFYTLEAEAILDDLSWSVLSERGEYARYLTQHPDGAHRDEARQALKKR